MEIIAFGMNHNNSPLEVLGKAVIAENRLGEALADFRAKLGAGHSANAQDETQNGGGVAEAALLSTCNRFEIYAVTGKGEDEDAIARWLCAYCNLSEDQVRAHCFTRRGHDAVRHLMRVAASLDAMMVGEPQILGQVKAAYRAAHDAKTSGPILSRLFESAISIAKKVRTETDLGKHPVSYESAAIKACRRLFENLPDKRVLLIGTGKMIQSAARHCRREGIAAVTVAGRLADKTRAIARTFEAEAIALSEVGDVLPAYDIVISCTASAEPILRRNAVAAAVKARRRRPMCIVDMALPRDVEASVAELPDAYLYTLEDLAAIVSDSQQARKAAAAQAEIAIGMKADEYLEWTDQRKVVEIIERLLAEADDIRGQALEQAMKSLRAGVSPEEALIRLSESLTAQLANPALETLKQAIESGELHNEIRQQFGK